VNPLAAVLSPLTDKPGEGDTKDEPSPESNLVVIVEAPLAPKRKEDEYWYRPPDSKARKLFEKIAVMREAGRSDAEIAKRLGTTEQSVRQYVYLAKRNGWASDDGEPVDVEAQLAMDVDRRVVRNITTSLDGGMTNWQTHEMTIAAAKGRGIFKNHDKVENSGGPTMDVVAIQIVQVQNALPVNEENVGGVPAFVDGQVVGGGPELGQAGNATEQTASPSLEPGREPVSVGGELAS
jgi:transposase